MYNLVVLTADQLKELLLSTLREFTNSRPSTPTNEKEILTIDEVAKLLQRTKQAVYTLVNKRQIPFAKPDGRLIFRRSQIMAWIDSGHKMTTGEVKEAVRRGKSFTSKTHKP